MLSLAKQFDTWLHKHLTVLLLLLLIVILRVPNFFEPYWYGDEAIYLTIGNALNDGERLYTEIVDHKTPIIYYLARVPNQLSFRLLNVAWMLATTVAFYYFAKRLISDNASVLVAGVVFVLMTTLPWFEGNLPNGELFVMGFVLVGAWILSKTTYFSAFLEERKSIDLGKDVPYVFTAGLFFGLGILTKVPAILDWGAFLLIGWLLIVNTLSFKPTQLKQWLRLALTTIGSLTVFAVGTIVPIIASIVYFNSVGSGQDYLDYGLLYNFRYAANWGLPFSSLLLQKVFTLPGKTLIMASILLVLSIRKQWFSRPYQFITGWFVMALFASLLSNRPYPHYFLQVMPPLALLSGLTIEMIEKSKKHWPAISFTGLVVGMSVAALLLLGFAPYRTLQYYDRFVKLLSGQWTVSQYRESFNHFMRDNYKAATIIRESGEDEIFIWGTNALLYALSSTQPVGKYTVSFHIKDFQAQGETMEAVKQKRPKFIVIMDEENEELPGLNEYLSEHYVMNSNYEYFSLWKRVDNVGSML
jgi:4-amino-4-deoxy-L-arabinose transferase-like glycosyltransferase